MREGEKRECVDLLCWVFFNQWSGEALGLSLNPRVQNSPSRTRNCCHPLPLSVPTSISESFGILNRNK